MFFKGQMENKNMTDPSKDSIFQDPTHTALAKYLGCFLVFG
jgi:hypothetical protein